MNGCRFKKKGYAFIRRDDGGPDLFAHFRQIDGNEESAIAFGVWFRACVVGCGSGLIHTKPHFCRSIATWRFLACAIQQLFPCALAQGARLEGSTLDSRD